MWCESAPPYCAHKICDAGGACTIDVLEDVGTGCASDGELCTLDVCDGAGTCLHQPQLEGESCDTDASVCTVEECTAGTCTKTSSVSCALCERCDAVEGCVEGRVPTCRALTDTLSSAKLTLRDDEGTARDAIAWASGRIYDLPAPGDLAATAGAEGMDVCLFLDSSVAAFVGGVSMPAGAQWRGTAEKAAFDSRTATGVAKARLTYKERTRQASFVTKAARDEAQLGFLPDPSAALVVELRRGDGACWSSSFRPPHLRASTSTSRRWIAPRKQ